MDCLECKNLGEAFESGLSKYIEARSAAYYRVSTELAAKKNVDMERARNDLEEHQLICVSPLRRDRLNQGPFERITEPPDVRLKVLAYSIHDIPTKLRRAGSLT